MKSRIMLALIGSAGFALASTGGAFAQQSCAEMIGQLQKDWTVQQETAAIEPNTAINPSEDDGQGDDTTTTTAQVYDPGMTTGNSDFDSALSEAYAADASGDAAACQSALDKARGMM